MNINNNLPPPPYSPPGTLPPHPGFIPSQSVRFQPHPENSVIITDGPMLMRPFGPHSTYIVCPYCRNAIRTRVISETLPKTHLFALFMCILGCWPCCILPYCLDCCQSQSHYCPQCNAFLGCYED